MTDLTPTPIAGEVLVNTDTTVFKYYSGITALTGGGFVVSWMSSGQDGSGWGVYAQRYDASGAAAGGEFRVNTHTASDQAYPSLTALDDGGFVISWNSFGQDGSGGGVYAQRYDASGAAAGGEFLVNTTTASEQLYPSLTALSDGGLVVSWVSNGQDGSSLGIYAQRFDASGAAAGGEFLVNTTTASEQHSPSLTALSDGGFVVSWSSWFQDGSGWGVYAQRFDASGTAAGGEFLVNSTTANDQSYPSLTALSDGGFVISWISDVQDGSVTGIYAQRFDASGAAAGGEFRVNTTTADYQLYPSLTALSDGGFVISWSSFNQDGSNWGVYAQRFDASGAAVGTEFLVNETTSGTQLQEFRPLQGITQLADGTLVATWYGYGVGDDNGVFIRQFALPSANAAPDGTDATLTLAEDATHIFAIADFGFTDADAGDTLNAVTITTLPSGGTLELGGVTVMAGERVAATDIAAGLLVFTPVADANGAGYASLSFQVEDAAGALDPLANTLTLDVTPVNDAPTGGVTISGIAAAGQMLHADQTFADADGLGPVTWQWLRDGATIDGATAQDYTVQPADRGHTLTAVASYVDGGGTNENGSGTIMVNMVELYDDTSTLIATYATIQEAIDAASAGWSIYLPDGTYTLAAQLNVNKDVTITGQSEAGVIIDGAGLVAGSYGILITADGAALSTLTLNGPTANVGTSYGIKIQPDTGDITDRIADVTLENVTVNGSGRSEIDVNSATNLTLTGITANGNNTGGVGIALTDTSGATLTDITTSGNLWGSVALYSANRFYDGATGNITFGGTYTASEAIKIFAQDASNGVTGDGNNEVGIPPVSHDLGAVTFPFAETWTVKNDSFNGAATQYSFYFGSEAEAQGFALGLQMAPSIVNTDSVVIGPDGVFHVYAGMSIQEAVDQAPNGATIEVHAGAYREQVLIDGKALTILGEDGATMEAPDNAAITSSGGFNSLLTAINGANVTIDNLDFDGRHQGNGFVTQTFAAVAFSNSDGAVTNGSVSGFTDAVFSGTQHGYGIIARGTGTARSVEIANMAISDYQKNGVDARGPGLDVNVHDNVITGIGATGVIAQNGVVLVNGATGTIDHNTVSAIGYTGSSATASGILVFSGGIADITNNTVSMAGAGIGTGAIVLVSSDAGAITGNTISDAAQGIDQSGTFTLAVATPDANSFTSVGTHFAFDPTDSSVTAYAVTGTGGTDYLDGSASNDDYTGGAGDDAVYGAGGTDTAHYADTLDLDDFATVASIPAIGGNPAGWQVTTAGGGTDSLSAVEIVTDGTHNFLLVGSGGFATIQEAVDAAQDGDTIIIAGGTYTEQVVIDGLNDLTIEAAIGETVIVQAPAVLTVNGTSGHWGDNVSAVIAVTGSTNVQINNIGVDGSFAGDTTPGSNGDELSGIAFLASSGGIDNVQIQNVSNSQGGGLFGLQHGNGLMFDGTGFAGPGMPTFSATDSTISAFQKTGALIWGADLTFTGNSITGIGATTLTAQNGLQIGGSQGTIANNAITQFGYQPLGTWYSSGIIAYEPTATLTIDGNQIIGAAGAETAGLDLSDLNGFDVDVTNNLFHTLSYGIYAYSYTGGTVGLDHQPDVSGNGFTNIAIEGLHIAPEESYGAPFATTAPFALNGTAFNDTLAGSLGADSFTGNGGDDSIDGRDGADTVTYSGLWTAYAISDAGGGSFGIVDERGGSPDGTDTVANVESYVFANGTLTAAELLNVAPTDLTLDNSAIDENLANGAVVGTVAATDANSLDILTYALLDDAGGRFVIDASTGVITVANSALLDAESAASHNVTVQVTDDAGSQYSEAYVITLNDLNEFAVTAPADSDPLANTVNENAANGTVVANLAISATDADATTNSVSYSLLDNAGGRFAINTSSGVVTVANGTLLDAEAATSHTITVLATSVDGSQAQSDFVIGVNNVPEQQVYIGTNDADVFVAPSDDDWSINALRGNDTITTQNGNDIFTAGAGNDVFSSGGGNDLFGFQGNTSANGYDSIDGGSGFDEIRALSNNTIISLVNVQNVELVNANGYSNINVIGTNAADTLDFSGATMIGISQIKGGSGNDTIIGSNSDDTILGERGNDILSGGEGNDLFLFKAGDGLDSYDGGNGYDTIRATSNSAVISSAAISNVELIDGGGFGAVQIAGTIGNDTIDLTGIATTGIAFIEGGKGNDTITGSDSADVIKLGFGQDVVAGGLGNDVFDMDKLTDSKIGGAFDTITDFLSGSDIIDLSTLDANSKVLGNDSFTFIGSSSFTNVAGQLRVDTSISGLTIIYGDTTGNGVANFELRLTGNHALSSADFVL